MKNCYALIISPHPDDSEFGIAGTVAKWTSEGKNVIYGICTNGNKGTDDPQLLPDKLTKIREKEQLAAAKILGVNEVIFLRHDDQSLEDTPEFRKEIVRLIRTYQPEVVATCDPYKRYLMWHRDHRITGQVVLDAVFPFARNYWAYPDLIEQGLMPYKVNEVLLWSPQEPNHFTDVFDTWDIKIAALCCHDSQVGQFISEREPELRARFEALAQGTGFKLVEAFHRIEILR